MDNRVMNKTLRMYIHGILKEQYQSHTFEPKLGDPVINTNTNCKHYGSEGVVKDISDLDDDAGKVIVYIVTNDGTEYSIGDVLEKTMDQLAPLDDMHEVRSHRSKEPVMKIRESKLRKIIRKSLIKEAHQTIIQNPYEDVDDYNVLANYALTGDIAGALADPALKHYVDKNEMGWLADEAIGWFNNVGKEGYDMPAPEGWDKKKAHQFLRDIEDAAYKEYDKMATAAIAGDPDKEFLEFLGNQWTSQIEPNDLPDIKWKEYKKYVRLKPPRSISHGVGEINISKEDINSLYSGAYDDFIDFLTTRTAGQLGRRAPYKRSPAPYYD